VWQAPFLALYRSDLLAKEVMAMQELHLRTEVMLELQALPQRSRSNQVVLKPEMVAMPVLQTQQIQTVGTSAMHKRFRFAQRELVLHPQQAVHRKVLPEPKERMRVVATARALLPLSSRRAMGSLRWVPWPHLLQQQPLWQLLRQVSLYPPGKDQTLAMLEMVSPVKPLQQQVKLQLPLPRLLNLLPLRPSPWPHHSQ
jgi:hypothetical protein